MSSFGSFVSFVQRTRTSVLNMSSDVRAAKQFHGKFKYLYIYLSLLNLTSISRKTATYPLHFLILFITGERHKF
jgi:hypothetical protein